MNKRLAKKIMKTITSRKHSIPRIMRAYHHLGKEYVRQHYGITNITIHKGYIAISDEIQKIEFDKPVLVIDKEVMNFFVSKSLSDRYAKNPLDSKYYKTITFGEIGNMNKQ